jgi:hypothetical protein
VILANLASSNGVSAIAEDDAHDNASVSSAIFPDSSDTSEAFSSLAIGDVIAKKYLYDECKTIAHQLGFEISIRGLSFRCSRASRGNDGPKRQNKVKVVPDTKKRKGSSKQCGCEWLVRFVPQKGAEESNIEREPGDILIRITALSLIHTNGCEPSPAQLTVQKKRSGTSTRALSMRKLHDCCKNLGEHGSLPYSFIRSQLKGVFPEDWVMDSHAITNFVVKCRLHKKEIADGANLHIDKDHPGWITVEGADNTDYVSRATRIAADMLKESMAKSSKVKAVDEYLHSLKLADKGFDYRISFSPDGVFSGVVWVTSHMRWNYENCGFCIFLDAMKRQQNALDWPYISVVVLNGYKKIGNACESVSCSERIVAYR